MNIWTTRINAHRALMTYAPGLAGDMLDQAEALGYDDHGTQHGLLTVRYRGNVPSDRAYLVTLEPGARYDGIMNGHLVYD